MNQHWTLEFNTAVSRPVFPTIAPELVADLNKVSARRVPVRQEWNDTYVILTPTFWTGADADFKIDSAISLSVAINDEILHLYIPTDALIKILKNEDLLNDIHQIKLGEILEFVFEELVIYLEKIFDTDIRINLVEGTSSPSDVDLFSKMRVGEDWFDIGMSCSFDFMKEMAAQLSDAEALRADVSNICVPCSITTHPVRISLGDLSAIQAGDAVIVQEHGLEIQEVWCRFSKTLLCEAKRDNAKITLSGELTAKRSEKCNMEKDMAISMESGEVQPKKESVDDVEIELTFEVGRRMFTIKELQRLAPGFIFEMEQEKGGDVVILASGKAIGEGELVEIGDALGVRAVKIFNQS